MLTADINWYGAQCQSYTVTAEGTDLLTDMLSIGGDQPSPYNVSLQHQFLELAVQTTKVPREPILITEYTHSVYAYTHSQAHTHSLTHTHTHSLSLSWYNPSISRLIAESMLMSSL